MANEGGNRTFWPSRMGLTLRGGSAQTWDFTFKDDGELATVVFGGETTTHDYLSDGRLKKITLPTGATCEHFYLDTDDSHGYALGKLVGVANVLEASVSAHTSIIIAERARPTAFERATTSFPLRPLSLTRLKRCAIAGT